MSFIFDSLEWRRHPVSPDGQIARLTLANGYILSVAYGEHLYGDGVETFEAAIISPATDRLLRLTEYGYEDTVAAGCTRDEVEALVARIAALPAVA